MNNFLKNQISKLQNKKEFILLFYTAFLFFFLEFVIFSALRFTTSYFHAQLIIAVGLLGLIFGGIAAVTIPKQSLQRGLRVACITLFFSALTGLGGIILSSTHFWTSSVLLCITFIPVGFIIGLLYRIVNPWHAYAIELLGGFGGLIAALFLIPLIREENMLIFAFPLTFSFFVVFYWNSIKDFSQKFLLLSFLFLSIALLVTNLKHDYLNFVRVATCRTPTDEKFILPKVACLKNLGIQYDILYSQGSIVDRIDILAVEGEEALTSVFSGAQIDVIQPFPPEDYSYDARIPSSILKEPKTLIIGAGMEGVVKPIKAIGAREITAVDLNFAVADIWKNNEAVKKYARNPFDGVLFEIIDGRTFLETHEEKFDLITMMNTHRTRNAGQFGQPDFLHTKEAFNLFWKHLSSSGVLVFEEPNFNSIAKKAINRITATLKESLEESGVGDPSQHVIIYEWIGSPPDVPLPSTTPFTYIQFVVKKTPWSTQDIVRLKKWAIETGRTDNRTKGNNAVFYKWVWLPSENFDISSSFARILTQKTGSGILSASVLTDVSPFPITATDFNNKLLWHSFAVFSGILFFALGWWHIKTRIHVLGIQTMFPIYFIFVGLGYMFIEILFIQRFQLYLGSVLLSFLSAIGGLLVASALGSWLMSKKRFYSNFFYSVTALMFVFVLLWYVLAGFPGLYLESLWLRFTVTIALASAVGLMLSTFFPYGLTRARAHFGVGLLPLLVGINGSAMALGVPLAFLVSSEWGFVALASFASILYIFSVVLISMADYNKVEL